MTFKIKESVYVHNGQTDYIVRQGTTGVERNRVVYFYDNTKTVAVGFPREACLENPQIFQGVRSLQDKDVSLKDVINVVEESGLSKQDADRLINNLNTL